MQNSKITKISVKTLEKYTRKFGNVFLKKRNTFFQKSEIWTNKVWTILISFRIYLCYNFPIGLKKILPLRGVKRWLKKS